MYFLQHRFSRSSFIAMLFKRGYTQVPKTEKNFDIEKISDYLTKGGKLGTLRTWSSRSVSRKIKQNIPSEKITNTEWHKCLISIVAKLPLDAVETLKFSISTVISKSPTAAQEIWLAELADRISLVDYESWYSMVITGLLKSTHLRQHGVLGFVAAVPAASMNQTFSTVRELLLLSNELKMSAARTQLMLDAFWIVHPSSPFVGLRNYLRPLQAFDSNELYLEHIKEKWESALPFM